MDGAGGAALRRWDTSSEYSFRTSASTTADVGGMEADEVVVEETSPRSVDGDRVFVAVPEDVRHGKSTLLWALENLVTDGARVVVAHVHCPAQMIPMMGAKVHYTTVNPQRVSDHRKTVRAEADAKLDAYVLMCRRLKVICEKIVIDNDNVAEGLEEFVALHGVTKLIMGAAADKRYSKKMKTPKSKTALKLMDAVAPSCKIWFTCKGHLICTREANTTVPAVNLPSPAHTVASLSSSNISSETRSGRIHRCESEASSLNGSPRHDPERSRTEMAHYPSQRVAITPSPLCEPFELHNNGTPRVTPRGSIDSLDEFGRRSRRSWCGPSINDDAVTISGPAMQNQMVDSNDENFSTPSQNMEKPGVDVDIYDTLADALIEAQISKTEAYEESIKRRKIEQDMISTIQKREFRQRQKLDETLKGQAHEIEETKRQREAMSNELHAVKEQKFVLEQQITEMTNVIKDHEEKMAENKHLLQVMQAENEKLQQERDTAVATAEGLRQKVSAPLPIEALNTEFSSFELEEATRGFDQALKIEEDRFGTAYKGFLRNTTVSVKLLHPESLSLHGQPEFNQQVAVLSRVRHPNLVTLMGTCREPFGLVYEFHPNGSLEDRLACTNNTPPLTWQVRTKIICEMCSALSFLHSNKPHPVVHGDLKPANIHLDANLVSKLGDFGISQILIQSTTMRPYQTTTSKGTFAYMDPEFLSDGELTPRSDVYSLGIIILRLLTGRHPQNIVKLVENAMSREELHAILDPTAGDWPFVQANQLAHIGLRCAEKSPRCRPDLAGEVWKVVEPLMKAASLTLGRPPPLAESPDDAHAPSYFLCPIFQEVMSDPHVAADGFTYEAEAIRGWFDSGHDTSPMTNLKLPHRELTPNRALRSAILEWQQ